MKKSRTMAILISLAAVLIVALSACGKSNNHANQQASSVMKLRALSLVPSKLRSLRTTIFGTFLVESTPRVTQDLKLTNSIQTLKR